MTDIALDFITYDLEIVGNRLSLITTEEVATKQRLLITLKAFKGEWLFNVDFGVSYLANDNNTIQLLGKSSKSLLDLHIKQAIINTEGITSLESYTSSLSTDRTVAVDFRAVTNSGDIIAITTTI